jgi:hypothetical protein
MAESAAVQKQEYALPHSATIKIHEQQAIPNTAVEVEPNVGRILFVNQDGTNYRLRFWKENTDPLAGIDVVLVPGGNFTIAINTNDSFYFTVLNDAGLTKEGNLEFGKYANGPIRN